MSRSFEEIHTSIYRKSLYKNIEISKIRNKQSRLKLGVANLLSLIPTGLSLWLLILSVIWLFESTVPLLTALFAIPLIYITGAPLVSNLFQRLPKRIYYRCDAPATFEFLDRLSERITDRKIDIIVVSKDMNASISLLRGKIALTIGVPLALALTREELHSVICHEIGHLRRDAKSPTEYFGISYLFNSADHWISMFDESTKPSEVSAGILVPIFWILKLLIKSYCTVVVHLVWSEKILSEFYADRAALIASRCQDLTTSLQKIESVDILRDALSYCRIHRIDFPEYYITHAQDRTLELLHEYQRRGAGLSQQEETVTDHPFVSDRIASLVNEVGQIQDLEATLEVVALISKDFPGVLREVQSDFDNMLGQR